MNKNRLYAAKTFNKLNINLKYEEKNPKVEIKMVGESEKYNIYKYKPDETLGYTYIIGQLKKNPKKFVYFSKNFDHVCVFNENLFLCNHSGELNTFNSFVHRINLKNKEEENYNLRDDRGKWIFINGYGRKYTQDNYETMNINNNELVINCHRTKNIEDKDAINDRFNKDMDFKIIIRYLENKFVPFYQIENTEYKLVAENNNSSAEANKIRKHENFLSKLDEFIIPFGLISILIIIIGLIACIITKFSNLIWNIIFILGIVGLAASDLINRYIGYSRKKIRNKKYS